MFLLLLLFVETEQPQTQAMKGVHSYPNTAPKKLSETYGWKKRSPVSARQSP